MTNVIDKLVSKWTGKATTTGLTLDGPVKDFARVGKAPFKTPDGMAYMSLGKLKAGTVFMDFGPYFVDAGRRTIADKWIGYPEEMTEVSLGIQKIRTPRDGERLYEVDARGFWFGDEWLLVEVVGNRINDHDFVRRERVLLVPKAAVHPEFSDLVPRGTEPTVPMTPPSHYPQSTENLIQMFEEVMSILVGRDIAQQLPKYEIRGTHKYFPRLVNKLNAQGCTSKLTRSDGGQMSLDAVGGEVNLRPGPIFGFSKNHPCQKELAAYLKAVATRVESLRGFNGNPARLYIDQQNQAIAIAECVGPTKVQLAFTSIDAAPPSKGTSLPSAWS